MSGPGETSHERFRDDLAAYALGALSEEEANLIGEHLEGCEECRRQLRWLEPAVDVLPRSVPQHRPPRRLRRRLMSTVRAESRASGRRRALRARGWSAMLWRPATAAAAGVLLAAGVGAGYLLHQPGGEEASVLAAHASAKAPQASGSLERTGDSGILHVQGMPALAANRVYEVWVRRDGTMQPASLFDTQTNRSGQAAVPGPLDSADAVLVTKEPRGGSPQPTSPPLLSVNLR